MPSPHDETCALPRLLAARQRYFGLRAALPCDCALDLDLHAELTETIRCLDRKIAAARQRQHPAPGTGDRAA